MKELDITELKMINGGGFAKDIGYVIGRTVGLLAWLVAGKYAK
jgi:hypothetical protein